MSATAQFLSTPPSANSVAEIRSRISLRKVTWAAPLVVVSARTVLLIVVQGLTAAVMAWRHVAHPWVAAGRWWTVYATLVDLACILLMWYFIRREGISFRDLIGRVRFRWGRDIWVGLGYFLVLFSLLGICLPLSARLIYGTWFPHFDQGIVVPSLPRWAVFYTLFVWWVIWSATEETTYQAYSLPRFEALIKRPWIAVFVVAFWWALQHCAIPLVLDWRYPLWRTLATFPGVLAFVLIYRRTRHLPPLIIGHWPGDIYVAIMTAMPAVFMR